MRMQTKKDEVSSSDTDSTKLQKPDWIRVKAPVSKEYQETLGLVRGQKLHTVCEEAACPNIGECWAKKHATFIILGDICTRGCTFCNIKTGRPGIVDMNEPERVAQAVVKLNLTHVVITSVTRDDLVDGGATHFANVIEKIRGASSHTTIEVLTPDFLRKEAALDIVVKARPDVYNHNLETVSRLYPIVRPGARYYHSLRLLERVKEKDPTIFTKSGIMVGLGEEKMEVFQVMDDMRCANVDFLTVGQYLQPTPNHHPVSRFVEPAEFDEYKEVGKGKGFLLIAASPLTRSSYHADADFQKLKSTPL